MKHSDSSIWKIHNKPLFYVFLTLYLVSMFLKMSNIVSPEIASTFTKMFIGFCIGGITIYTIREPEMVKSRFKQILPFMVVFILFGIVWYFIMKSKYGI